MRGCCRLLVLGAVVFAACARTPPGPSVDDLVSQGGALDLEGEHTAAVARFRQALVLAPDSYDAHYGIGRALDLAGEYDEAREHFTRAMALASDENRDQAVRMLGIAWTFVGNVDEAAQCFREVFDRRMKAGNFAAASEVANELGRVYLETGNLDRGEEWYRTGRDVALQEQNLPDWRRGLVELRWAHAQGRVAARRGREREARQAEAVVKAVLDRGGNDDQRVQYQYLLGYVDFHLGHYQDAIDALLKADQTDPFILLLLASAEEKLDHPARRDDYYRKVLESSSHAINNALARPVARSKLP
jgi:tetratricopeptide (TPR) repeat protein